MADQTTEVHCQLNCGCEVTLELDANRWLRVADGTFIVVGKYVCPVGHCTTR